MAAQYNVFILVNITGKESFIFRLFPREIETEGQSNWQPQDVTIGTKPLFYANREPLRHRINDLWLDNTHTGDSIAPEIQQLLDLQAEFAQPHSVPPRNAPPVLLAQWGDERFICILERVRVTRTFFTSDGAPLRANIGLELLEIQDSEIRVPVTVTTDDNSAPSGQVSGGRVFGPQP